MAKLRLTKNELKKQKDKLKRFNLYLPTLQLKKKQLQIELAKIHNAIEKNTQGKEYIKALVYRWVEVFSEDVRINEIIRLGSIETSEGNIAGTDIPIFEKVIFEEKEYDLEKTPLWVDYAVEEIKKVITINAEIAVLKKQNRLILEELRVTTQRVNLFEKIMIPGAQKNIKKIRIYLGDMMTAAVVTGKIAKEKISEDA